MFILSGVLDKGLKKEFASVVDATGAKLLRTCQQLDKAIVNKSAESYIIIITKDAKSDTLNNVDGVDFWVQKSTFVLAVKHQDRGLVLPNS